MDVTTPSRDGRFSLGRKMQVAFLVDDLDEALAVWTEKLGVGPFVVFEHSLGKRDFIYRGQRSSAHISLALSYVGETQIELICQRNDAPTIYTEALSKGFLYGGTHHIAFWPDDMQAAWRQLTAQGFEEVASIRGANGDVDVYYFASPPGLNVMLEIVPMTSARRVYFSKIKALCEQPSVGSNVMRFQDKDDFLNSLAKEAK